STTASCLHLLFFACARPPPPLPLFPYTTLFRSPAAGVGVRVEGPHLHAADALLQQARRELAGVAVHPGIQVLVRAAHPTSIAGRSEEHTSELQSPDPSRMPSSA